MIYINFGNPIALSVQALTWNLGSLPAPGSGAPSVTKAEFSTAYFTMKTDPNKSPTVFSFCIGGRRFPSVWIDLCEDLPERTGVDLLPPDRQGPVHVRYILSDARIDGVTTSSEIDVVTLLFRTKNYSYFGGMHG